MKNNKIDASNLIDDLSKENKFTFDEINFKIFKEFGLSERFVKQYINQLITLHKVMIKDNGIVVWIEKDNQEVENGKEDN